RGRSRNAYLDIEGRHGIRQQVNALNNQGFYGQWSMFSVLNFNDGYTALKELNEITGARLANLVIETHGGGGTDPAFKLNDSESTAYTNYLYNSDLNRVLGNVYASNCDESEAKARQF